MNKKIVIPIDFSDTSRNALHYALSFLGKDKSDIYLLNAFEPPHMGSGMLISINDILEKESKSALNQEINKLKEANKINGYHFETISENGNLVGSLKKWSKKIKFDYVMLGTNGAAGIKGALFGSNASEVIDCAEIPVMTIPAEAKFNGLNKILFAYDGLSFSTQKPVEELNFLKEEFGAEIHVLHIDKPANHEHKNEIQKNLTDLKNKLKLEDFHFHKEYYESAIEGIHDFTLKNPNYDLVCMVPRKKTFIFKFSKTKAISIGTKIPLWTLRD